MMVTEKLTLGDIRAAAMTTDGIRIGGWQVEDETPLVEPFQEMADDIADWFNPLQGWKLTEVRFGLINLKRIEQSSVAYGGPHDGEAVFKARVETPDTFTPAFHFEAENPPLKGNFFRSEKRLFLPEVLTPEMRARSSQAFWMLTGIDVGRPVKIGSVYPLEQALKELSSPYYLGGVRLTTRGANNGIAIMVFMYDLIDYVRLETKRIRGEANRFSGIGRKLNKKFPS